MAEFRMPSLGADMEAGTLLEWRVKAGDRVKRGDVVALVDTEKASIEIEIFLDGVIERLLVQEGEKVPVGTVLAIVSGDAGAERPAAAGAAAEIAPAAENVRKAPPAAPAPGAPLPPSTRRKVSPLARKMAAERGVDLARVEGSGADGAVTVADVERAASQAAPAPEATVAREGREGMRRAIAAAMARSKREIPHYYLGTTIDLARAMAWLEAENLRRPVAARLLPAALLLRAVALAAREVPEMNGFWVEGAFRPAERVHLGVAVSLRTGGLIAPAILDAGGKALDALMADLRDLVKRARAGSLRSSELSESTLTVTNLGDQGVESVYGVIYPPQVALVGFGRIVERPWAEKGVVGVRPVVTATLAADHRASDGHRGGLFLAAVDRFLQEPERL
jgi:pyruvate dehydrogenase E2 component (dihydrolipoamide acetyltransferase)